MNATTATQLLEQSKKDLAAAEQHLRALQAEEAKHAANPSSYESWKKSRDDAQSEVARLRLVVEQRQTDVQTEALELWRTDKARQGQVNDALAKRMQADGPELVQRLLTWVTDIAAAEAETARINMRMPNGEARLAGPDALARTVGRQAEEITREVDVELWVIAATGQIVPDQRAVVVISDTEATAGSWQTPCAKRRFREVTYLPEIDVQRATPFIEALRLPFFERPGLVWNGDVADHPAKIRQMLDASSGGASSSTERQEQVRYVASEPWTAPPQKLTSVGRRAGTGKNQR
ncbi:hypothetical protein [Bradyrhizobium sp. USDA 4471]